MQQNPKGGMHSKMHNGKYETALPQRERDECISCWWDTKCINRRAWHQQSIFIRSKSLYLFTSFCQKESQTNNIYFCAGALLWVCSYIFINTGIHKQRVYTSSVIYCYIITWILLVPRLKWNNLPINADTGKPRNTDPSSLQLPLCHTWRNYSPRYDWLLLHL